MLRCSPLIVGPDKRDVIRAIPDTSRSVLQTVRGPLRDDLQGRNKSPIGAFLTSVLAVHGCNPDFLTHRRMADHVASPLKGYSH